MTSLRPDEYAMYSEIERAQKRDNNLSKGLKTAASIGGAALGLAGSGVASKIAPFLSEYIPSDLAMKGISKVAPKIGDFLKRGKASGLDIEEGLNYLKDTFFPNKNKEEEQTQQEQQPEQKQNDNIIAQYSPELAQFIEAGIQKGMSPQEVGLTAVKGNPKFKQVLDVIQTDHQTPWINILEQIYGTGGQAPSQQGQQPQTQQPQQRQQQGQGQMGPGMQKLAELLAQRQKR